MLRKNILVIFAVLIFLVGCGKEGTNPFDPSTEDQISAPAEDSEDEEAAVLCWSKRGKFPPRWKFPRRRKFHLFEVSVVYLNPSYYTEDSLPGFQIGQALNYEIHIKSKCRIITLKRLTIKTTKEYGESGTCNRYWYPYPLVVDFTQGDPLPGDSTHEWTELTISPGETKVLAGSYTIPLEACSARGQTHVEITLVWKWPGKHKGWRRGRHRGNPPHEWVTTHSLILYDNPQNGNFYLKPPGRRR